MALSGTSKSYQEIVGRLDAVRRKELRVGLMFGLQAVVLAVLGVVTLVVAFEELLRLGTTGRTVVFFLALAAIAVVAARFVLPPLLRIFGALPGPSIADAARKVGGQFPAVRDRLLDALQLFEGLESSQSLYSASLVEASVADLAGQVAKLNFLSAVDARSLRKGRRAVYYAFAVAVLVLVISPSGFFLSLYRLSHFQETFAATPSIQIFVEPGNVNAVRGQTIGVTVRTEGAPVSSLTLYSRMEGEAEFEKEQLAQSNGAFHGEFKSIKTSTEYFASASDKESEHYKITVLDRPLIRSFRLTMTPPSYTHLPSTTADDNAGDITAYPGTSVRLELTASKPVNAAALHFSDSNTVNLQAAGTSVTGMFRPKKNGTYHIVLQDAAGLQNIDAVEYAITMLADAAPSIEIVAPGKNVNLTESMNMALLVRIKDDFGFSKLRLAWRLAQSRYVQPEEKFNEIDLPLPESGQIQADVPYAWDLSPLHLVPEDAVAYYAEVFDNDNVNGPKSTRSETFYLRLPSLEEVFSDVQQSHEQSVESMQGIAKEAEQMRKDMDDLQREMRKNPQHPDWQQQKKAEELLQRYDALQKKVNDVAQRLDETVKQMDENKLLSDKTMEKYDELRKLMEQINSPNLREALKRLQEALKQQSAPQMQQAMDQMKFSEEQFRESLERTLELLKRIHIEQKLDELIKRTEEMGKTQEELQNQAKNTPQSDQQKRSELAKRQNDLKQQAESLQKETEDVRKKMEEFAEDMPLKEMEQAQKQLDSSAIDKQMEQSSQQISSGDMSKAQQQQQQSKKDLDSFAQQLKNAQKSMQDSQQKETVDKLRKQAKNLLELSRQEEGLKNETQGLDPNSRNFRESMQKQDDVRNGLGNVADQMGELSKKSFAVTPEMSREMGNAMRAMDEAMKQMEARQPGGSSQQQTQAMGSLNNAAKLMQDAIGSMMNSGSGGSGMPGLLGQLGQLSGQQGQINQGTKDAMGNGPGQGLTSEQQAAYSRLAGQQAQTQKSLKQLSEEAKNSGDFGRLMGDLDKIAQEMAEVQTDLEQNNVNPNTLQKEDRILSRLLDSQRSMRERDYEKRRKAETGKAVPHEGPAGLDLSTQEGKNKLREELLRVLDAKYAKDYEVLIRKYFEALDKQQADQQ